MVTELSPKLVRHKISQIFPSLFYFKLNLLKQRQTEQTQHNKKMCGCPNTSVWTIYCNMAESHIIYVHCVVLLCKSLHILYVKKNKLKTHFDSFEFKFGINSLDNRVLQSNNVLFISSRYGNSQSKYKINLNYCPALTCSDYKTLDRQLGIVLE